MNRPATIYARVSSDRQKENHTITSQTAALKEYAQTHDYLVPAEWVFEDEGYSGATLVRPGLEALRDLAARGEIQAALVYSPDRLSRKYAYQVLLAEELQRCGVSLVYLKAPAGETAEDRLLEQFQGMIAEYERAQILERSRRGKRHKAQAGVVNVLSAAPYGYRYVKKSDTAEAYYEVLEAEAEVVRTVFDLYTRAGLSINAIARHLNQQQIATRGADTRWERSTVWALLRNPAYQGKACYGKTEIRPRQRITRPLRQHNRLPSRNSANHERPRQDWIEIPVPALVNEQTFAFAQEQLEKNRHYSRRRTIEPTLLQGMLVCRDCGYALYRTSTRTSARKLYYYRCLGSDAYRHLRGALCANRPVRQDYLDQLVWREIMRLLEEPALVQTEIDRRLAEAQAADPLRHREQSLRHQQVRLSNGIERLLTAYQEELLSLEQLRGRMPALRKQQQAVEAELQSLAFAAADQSRYLRLTETLADFCLKLHARADALDVTEKQKIARLLVQEILVGGDTIVIRHSIPLLKSESEGRGSSVPPAPIPPRDPSLGAASYLLRSGGNYSTLRRAGLRVFDCPVFHHTRVQPLADEPQQHSVTYPLAHDVSQVTMGQGPEKVSDIDLKNPLARHLHRLALHDSQRLMRRASRPEAV
jgi:site-specific DNA recombinase